jgi:hypothetical protein
MFRPSLALRQLDDGVDELRAVEQDPVVVVGGDLDQLGQQLAGTFRDAWLTRRWREAILEEKRRS